MIYLSKHIRTFFVLFFLIFNTGLLFSNSSDKITVSKIRVFLDDFELTNDDELNPSIQNSFDLQTILSFTNLKSGKEMSLTAFEKEVIQTQLRLLNSGYFYEARVEIVPPRKNPEKRSVVISVTTGFLQRFGGGGIYAVYGRVGLGGNRCQLIGFAGYNLNGIEFLNENCFNTNLIFGAALSTNAPACFVSEILPEINGKIKLGTFINSDFRFCTDFCVNFNFAKSKAPVQKTLCISPYFAFDKYLSGKIFTTNEIRLYWKPFTSLTMEAVQTLNFQISQKFDFAVLLCGGKTILENKNSLFNLSSNNTTVSSNAGFSNRCIRGDYEDSELMAKDYILFSSELRFTAAKFIIPPIFPCEIVPFIFTDIAYSENGEQDGFGLGVQLNFACPIFAYFNFMYGINHCGKGKFFFSAKKSF